MLEIVLHILLISIAKAKRYPKTFNLLHKCFKYFMTVLDYTFWFVLEFLARYSGATPAGWSWLYQYKYLCTLWQSGPWQWSSGPIRGQCFWHLTNEKQRMMWACNILTAPGMRGPSLQGSHCSHHKNTQTGSLNEHDSKSMSWKFLSSFKDLAGTI